MSPSVHQTLMTGLRAAARKPTNLSKVNLIRQEPNESPAAFLERLMEAFRQYTPMDPQADESRTAVLLAFVNQAAPDIRLPRCPIMVIMLSGDALAAHLWS